MRTVTVELIHTERPWWRTGSRWQPWRWVAKAENGRVIATSAESYTNRQDCLDALALLFGRHTAVMLKDGDDLAVLRASR